MSGGYDIGAGIGPGVGSGSILFWDGTNITGDSANLFWDNTNKRVGIGTNSPQASLHVASGQILGPNGATGAPGFAFVGDSATGMYFNPSTSGGSLFFSVGGDTRFSIYDSAGYTDHKGAFAPSTGNTYELGISGQPWLITYSRFFRAGGNLTGIQNLYQTVFSSSAAIAFDLSNGNLWQFIAFDGTSYNELEFLNASTRWTVRPIANASANATAAKELRIQAANKTAGTGNGGALVLAAGTTSGGTAGITTFETAGTLRGTIGATGLWGIGAHTPASLLHVDIGNSSASNCLQITQGSTTGVTATDGFTVAWSTAGSVNLDHRLRENGYQGWWVNNTEYMRLRPIGRLTVGDVTETVAFFFTDVTKFAVASEITDINNIISLEACTTAKINPSGNTNTGAFTVTIFGAQGFNTDITGSVNYNGGIPVGGSGFAVSAIGAFGQVNVASSGSVDGVAGLLCTINHQGNGATLANGSGAIFGFSTAVDLGNTGSVTTGIGGIFTCYIDSNLTDKDGVSITNGVGAKFIEPYLVSGGAYGSTITNKTAAWVDGTLSITQTTVATSGNIAALAVATSYIRLTGNPTVQGIDADTFNKVVILAFTAGGVVANQNGSAAAGDRIITGSGADITITGDGAVMLVYDTTDTRWRVISSTL